MALMRRMVLNGEINALVPDRVWKEAELALRGPNCRVFFETLRNCGALRVLLPELDALFGVPQPARWHPEVDTGLHTMLSLEQAEQLSDDLPVRFAVMAHDLGKGLTPPREWPSHRGHEKRERKPIRNIADRLPVPRDCRDLALLVAEFHTHCHRAAELRHSTMVKVLERTDAFRRPERFGQFLLACEADARGRTGLESRAYPQADAMRKALRAAMSVDAAAIAAESGPAQIPKRIRAARIDAVAAARS